MSESMAKEINCHNFVALFDQLRKRCGNEAVERLIADMLDNGHYFIEDRHTGRPIPIQSHHLTDSTCWVSNAFSHDLYGQAARLLGGSEKLVDAGQQAVVDRLSRYLLLGARLFGIRPLAYQAARINARFNRTKHVVLAELEEGKAVFDLTYKPGMAVSKDICRWNLGIYTGIGRVAGLRDIVARETMCAADGHAHCRFEIFWCKESLWSRCKQALLRLVMKDLAADYEKTLEERDRLIEDLSREKEKFQLLTDEAPLAVALVGADGAIRYFNRRIVEMFGYNRADTPTVEQWLARVSISEQARHQAAQLWAKTLADPSADPLRLRTFVARAKDGSAKNVQAWHMILSTGDHMMVFEDVTAKQQLEAELKQARKMEAIGTLAGGIAHDFNNILAAMMGYTELVLIGLPPDHPETAHLKKILEAGDRAKGMVSQILAFSRKSDRSRREPVNLAAVIKEVIGLIRTGLPATITVDLDLPATALMVVADPTQIHQVLMNLATNALHAMEPAGGTLSIRLEAAADSGQEKPEAQLTVADTGQGIDPAIIDRIFDPYFTTKEKGRGTGMGLAVAHGIIASHGGRIHVTSTEGRGATFVIALPLYQGPVVQPSPARETGPTTAGGHESIIVVDDEPGLAETTSQLLAQLGYRVHTRTRPQEALELITCQEDVDLLVTDMTMPTMTGMALAQAAWLVRPRLPVVVCTGYSDQLDEPKARSLGVAAFLLKPVRANELAAAVRRALDRHTTKNSDG